MKKVDFKHPDWIMVAMWWFGVAIALFSGAFVGAGVVSVIAALRTWITYKMAKIDD